MSDKMTKIDRPVLVAHICHLSKVENEFEQLLNLPERQVSYYDASMFDDEKEAIENIELESEEGTAWSLHHIAPLTAQVPLYQGANTAANVNLSMAVNYSGPKSQLRDSLLSKASLHGPRQNEPLSSLSARPVLNTKVLNAQVSSTQTAGIQAASSQGPDMQVLSQKDTIIKVFSITASVVAQGNIQSEVSIDGITSTETVKRLSSLTPSQLHQSPMPNNAVGRDPGANAPVLMLKVPTQREAVSKESMLQVPAQKEPLSKESAAGHTLVSKPVGPSVNQVQSESSASQTIRLHSALTPPQPEQSFVSVGRDVPMLMSKVPTQREAVSKESMLQVPAQKEPLSKESAAGHALVSKSVGPSVNQVQSESSANQTIRLHSALTPPQPEQSFVSVGRDVPMLMSKVPTQREAVSKESMLQVPAQKEPLSKESAAGHALVSKPVGPSLNQVQSESSANQTIRLHSALTPPQPEQSFVSVGRDVPMLMSKESVPQIPVLVVPASKELMSKVPVSNASTVASKLCSSSVDQHERSIASKHVEQYIGKFVCKAQSDSNTNQPIASEATKLQPVLTQLKSVSQMQPKPSANRSVEVRGDTHVEKTAVLVPLNTEVRENNTQASVMLTQEEASPVLLTRMELFGFGAKLAAGHMLTSVQPVLFSPVLHYQISPEYFTHYAQLNTYRVFFRNKYYLFQFEDHKVTNFLEGYYDRH
ncbi:hypothetical protein [Shewanella sp. S23-S33]|uniref:hypothetical protein n=1 Tax=Shewanella sp. S23-S33 TaxID=3342769 RepID=UPI00372CEB05